MRNVATTMINAGNMSLATLTSPALNKINYPYVYIQCIATGAPVGTLSVLASADKITFNVVTGATASISAAGTTIFNFTTPLAAQWIEVQYVRTSGTGSLTVKANLLGES